MRGILRSCLIVGIPVSVCGMLAAALLLTKLDVSMQHYPFFAAIPLLCGCFFAGLSTGRRQRHGGLYHGLLAAFLLTVLWYLAVFGCTHALHFPWVLFAAIPCGMCGGVIGVNLKAPAIHRPPHRMIGGRERLILRTKLLHKPPKIKQER